MPNLDAPARRKTRAVVERRLCEVVEGVEFWIELRGVGRLRCMITGVALHRHYGAQEDEPRSWLASFDRHCGDIEARAVDASGRREDVHVVILCDAAGALRTLASRIPV